MKKLIIDSFNRDMCPLVRHRDMLKKYELLSVIPAKGFAWEGKDICALDGGVPTDFLLGESFSDDVTKCGAVLLGNSARRKDFERNLDMEMLDFSSIEELKQGQDVQPDEILKKIPVPVVMVMGLGENCQKFDIQIGLRRAFIRDGYKASQFGTKPYSPLFGFNALPDASEFPLWKKVYMYNQLFYETCEREKPDVLIVGIPGGMMPLNSYETQFFGEMALVLTSAARPDFMALSFYYIQPNQDFFELMRKYLHFRFSVDNVCFHASNTKLMDEPSARKVDYLTLDSDFVLKNQVKFDESAGQPLFNALIPESCEPGYRRIIEKLRQNVCVL